MAFIQADNHWTPTGRHGVVSYTGSLEDSLNRAISLLPRKARRTYRDVLYLIHRNIDGSESFLFELIDD